MATEKKKIEVVNGDGSNLKISPVYDHIKDVIPKTTKKRNIIVPDEKKSKNTKK